jgi:uncharacterized repeat protein (TIGR01451 family)
MSQKNSLYRLRTLSGWRSPLVALVAVLALVGGISFVGLGSNVASAVTTPTPTPTGPIIGTGVTFSYSTVIKTSLNVVRPANTANAVGDVVTYTVTATNTNAYPIDGLSWSWVNATKGTCVTEDMGTSVSRTCVATHTVTSGDLAAGKIENLHVTLTGKPQGGSNKDKTVTFGSDAPSLSLVTPALSISASSSSTPTKFDDVITYSVTVTNTAGPSLAGVSISNSAVDFGTCTSKTLATKNETLVCSATHHVSQAEVNAGHFSTTFTGTSTTSDVASKSDTVDVTIAGTAVLALTKVQIGDAPTKKDEVLSWTIVATNDGTRTLSNVHVLDARAASLYLSSGTIFDSCSALTLLPGTTLTCTATQSMTQANINSGGFDNTATASATDSAPGAATVHATDALAHTDIVRLPVLTVDQSAITTAVRFAGERVVRTITATNEGNVTLDGVTLTDSSVDFSSCQFTVGSVTTSVAFAPLSLDPGESISCAASHELTQAEVDSGTYANSVMASSTTTSPVTELAVSDSSDATATITADPQVSITLATSSAPTAAGDDITFTVVAKNEGNVSLTDFTVSDDAGTNFVGTACAVSAKVAPGAADTTCTFVHKVTQDDVDFGSFTDAAHVSGTKPAGAPVTVATTDPVVIPIAGTVQYSVVTTQTSANPRKEGALITWSVVVENTGTKSLKNLLVVDSKATLLNCPTVAKVVPKAVVSCTASHKLTDREFEANYYSNSAVASTSTDGSSVTSNTVNTVYGSVDRTLTLSTATPTRLTSQTAMLTPSLSAPGGEIKYFVRSSTAGCVIDNNTVIAKSSGTCVVAATVTMYRTLTSAVSNDVTITFTKPVVVPVVKSPASIRELSSGRDR